MTDPLNLERSYKQAPQTNHANEAEAAYVPLQPYSLLVGKKNMDAISLKLLDETKKHNKERIKLQKCLFDAQLWERRCKESEAEKRRLEREIERLQKAHATDIKDMDGFQDNSLVRNLF